MRSTIEDRVAPGTAGSVPGRGGRRCGGLGRAILGSALVAGSALLSAPPEATAAGRVALVVGNGTYVHIGRLPNPGNDAADMTAALRRLGFDVTTVNDADRNGMTDALRVFTRESAGADVSLVFYAGHGLEMDGVNYLVPVDARLERDTDVRFEAVELDDVLVATEGAELRVVILDACRNNPLARSMQRTSTRRSVSRGSFGDLDESLLGEETLVAYAAAAGTTAADGTGRNSPYTAALLELLEEPLEIGILFREVRARVLAATDGQQRPHEYASLLEEHYLRGTSRPGSATVAGGAPTEAQVQQESLFWQSIAGSSNPADYRAYLEQFPDGVFASLARNRVTEFAGATVDAPTVSRPRPGADRPPSSDPPGAPAPGTVFRDCDDCPEMVMLPAGTFQMGCVSGSDDCRNNEQRVREVDVGSFALGKYEVTRGEFAAFVSTTGHVVRGCRAYVWTDPTFAGPRWEWKDRGRASWQQPEFDQQASEPVVCVNWQDASAYVRWLSEETGEKYRLPSEAEWEYAGRAGTTTASYWDGGDDAQCVHANGADRTAERTFEKQKFRWTFSGCTDGEARTAPVGSFEPNAFGLHDMLGNVWEWVEDCYDADYGDAPRDGSAWTRRDCSRRVMRGGSWLNPPSFLRSAVRASSDAGRRDVHSGFRVARTLD